MTLDWETIIVGGLSAVGGGLLAKAFEWATSRKAVKINGAAKLVTAAGNVVQSYDVLVEELKATSDRREKQIEILESQQIEFRADIAVLQDENERLAREIEALKLDYQELSDRYRQVLAENRALKTAYDTK